MPAPPRRKPSFRLLTGLVAGVTVLGFLGGVWWLFDLLAHFRMHLTAASAVLVVATLFDRQPRDVAVAAAALVVNAATVIPLWVAGPSSGSTSPVHSLLLANVLTSNDAHGPFVDYVLDATPDIVVLLEVDRGWWKNLEPLRQQYPHQVVRTRDDNFGVAVLSRLALTQSEVFTLAHPVPMVRATVHTGDGELHLVAAHPLPPVSGANSARRDAQLLSLADQLAERANPATLVVGDLNATPWSWAFRRLATKARLHDASRGHTSRPTWPARLGWLGIPIDQVLHGDGVEIVDERVGPDVGSDHRPVQVWFRHSR